MPDTDDIPNGAAPEGDELAELRALAARVGPAEVTWETPPANLWDRIASEADLPDESVDEPDDVPAAGLDETAIIEPLPEADLDATIGDLPVLTVPGNSGLDPTGVIRLPGTAASLEDTPVSGMTTAVRDDALEPTAVLETLPHGEAAVDVRPEATEPDETPSSEIDADAGSEGVPTDGDLAPSPVEAGPEATPIDSTVAPSPVEAGPAPAPFDWTNPPDLAVAGTGPDPIDEPLPPVPADTAGDLDPEATAFDGTLPPPPVEADSPPAERDEAAPEVRAEAVAGRVPDPSAQADADLDGAIEHPPVGPDLEATAFDDAVPPPPVGLDNQPAPLDGTAPPLPAAVDPDATAHQETLPPPPAESDEIAFDGSFPDPPADPEEPKPGPGATVHGIDAARNRRSPGRGFAVGDLPRWVLVAAAIVVVLGLGGLITRLGSGDDTKVVAASALEPLGDSGKGQAELVDRNGSLELQVDATGVDAGDGFLEVWVIDPEVKKLISLGPLRRDGIYDLPKRYDPKDFPIVDVSIEPVDGNPGHSGVSVLRGTLET